MKPPALHDPHPSRIATALPIKTRPGRHLQANQEGLDGYMRGLSSDPCTDLAASSSVTGHPGRATPRPFAVPCLCAHFAMRGPPTSTFPSPMLHIYPARPTSRTERYMDMVVIIARLPGLVSHHLRRAACIAITNLA